MISLSFRKLGVRGIKYAHACRFAHKRTSEPYSKIKVVYSQSTNIYDNLALENILFHKEPLDKPILMLWRNTKAVVMGKHQNPFKESYMDRIKQDGIKLARR